MGEEEGQTKGSLTKMIFFIAVLVGVFIALKFVIGTLMTVLKWMAIGVLALGVTWFLFKKKKGSTSNS